MVCNVSELANVSRSVKNFPKKMDKVKGGAKMNRLLKVSEIAQIARVTNPTVHQWIYSKKLPAHKVGGSWRIVLADLQKFLKGDV
jgi:excisionase family DNA binding protein